MNNRTFQTVESEKLTPKFYMNNSCAFLKGGTGVLYLFLKTLFFVLGGGMFFHIFNFINFFENLVIKLSYGMKEQPLKPSEHTQGQVWTQTFVCYFLFSKKLTLESFRGSGDQQLFFPPCLMTDLASNNLCSTGTWYKMITTLCGFLGRGCWTNSMLDIGTQSLHCCIGVSLSFHWCFRHI